MGFEIVFLSGERLLDPLGDPFAAAKRLNEAGDALVEFQSADWVAFVNPRAVALIREPLSD